MVKMMVKMLVVSGVMALGLVLPASAQQAAGAAAGAAADREAVRQAALDYVEGIYLTDVSRIERSVHPLLTKRGFWRNTPTTAWSPQQTMTYEQLVKLAQTWNADKKRDTSIKQVDIYEVLDQTASAKVTAFWGIDYLHLAKYGGRWQIINIVWQAHPAK